MIQIDCDERWFVREGLSKDVLSQPRAKSMVAVGLRQNQNRGKGWAATTASVDNRNLSFVELYPTLS